MMASIIGGWEWFWRQESQMVDWHAIEARKLAFQARWPEAIMVLEEALSQLEPRVVCESLRRRVTDLLELYTKKEKEWMAQEKERMAQERDVKFVLRSTTPAFWGPLTPRREGMIGRPSSPGISGHSASTGLTSIRCHPRERRSDPGQAPGDPRGAGGGARRLGVASRPTRGVATFDHRSRGRLRSPAQSNPRCGGQEGCPGITPTGTRSRSGASTRRHASSSG